MKKKLIFAISLLATVVFLRGEKEEEHYQLDWSGLAQYNAEPEWFQDAKFGIYFHWGVYSVPAYGNEWYPRWMHFEGTKEYMHHLETYGHPSKFGYHDFVPMFKAESFDANEWAALFKQAGARFAGPVAEHHDGFSMWASKITPWNVKDKGPQRDITGELEQSIRHEGLKFVTTFHHARNLQRVDEPESYEPPYPDRKFFWNSHYPPVEGMATASDDPELQYLYGRIPAEKWLKEVWLGKLKEVIDNYHPDIIWFDSWLDRVPESYRKEYLEYAYAEGKKHGQEVVTTFKQHDLPNGTAVFNIEKGGMTEISPHVWQSDDTISMGSWCFTEDLKIKPAKMVIHSLIDIVSKNGVLLLNISPRADGIIPDDQRDVLVAMGKWLERNGAAIYATRPWLTYGEGPTGFEEGHFGGMKTTNVYTPEDKRYTRSKDGKRIYCMVLGKPEAGSKILLTAFSEGAVGADVRIHSISMMGSSESVIWTQSARGIEIDPQGLELSDTASVFVLGVES